MASEDHERSVSNRLLAHLFVLPSAGCAGIIERADAGAMLPMLAFAALWFRYRKIDRRIAPGFIWDIFLIVSAVGMLLFGFWAGWDKIQSFFFK